MAVSSGSTGIVLSGDIEFLAGGMDVKHLIGATVKSITPAGDNASIAVVAQAPDGTDQTVTIPLTGDDVNPYLYRIVREHSFNVVTANTVVATTGEGYEIEAIPAETVSGGLTHETPFLTHWEGFLYVSTTANAFMEVLSRFSHTIGANTFDSDRVAHYRIRANELKTITLQDFSSETTLPAPGTYTTRDGTRLTITQEQLDGDIGIQHSFYIRFYTDASYGVRQSRTINRLEGANILASFSQLQFVTTQAAAAVDSTARQQIASLQELTSDIHHSDSSATVWLGATATGAGIVLRTDRTNPTGQTYATSIVPPYPTSAQDLLVRIPVDDDVRNYRVMYGGELIQGNAWGNPFFTGGTYKFYSAFRGTRTILTGISSITLQQTATAPDTFYAGVVPGLEQALETISEVQVEVEAVAEQQSNIVTELAAKQSESQVEALIDDDVATWAQTGDTSLIPDDKLPTDLGGLSQDEVDARVRAGVQDWAETGNTERLPETKLPANNVTAANVENSIDPYVSQWAQEGNTDLIPSAKLPAGGGGASDEVVDDIDDEVRTLQHLTRDLVNFTSDAEHSFRDVSNPAFIVYTDEQWTTNRPDLSHINDNLFSRTLSSSVINAAVRIILRTGQDVDPRSLRIVAHRTDGRNLRQEYGNEWTRLEPDSTHSSNHSYYLVWHSQFGAVDFTDDPAITLSAQQTTDGQAVGGDSVYEGDVATVEAWAKVGNVDPIPGAKIADELVQGSESVDEHDGRISIADPGRNALWGGPSFIPRGSPDVGSVHFSSTRPNPQRSALLSPQSVPAHLSQFFTIDSAQGGVRFGEHIPEGLTVQLQAAFNDGDVRNSDPRIQVQQRRNGATVATIINNTPNVPATATAQMLNVVTLNADLSSVSFAPHDELVVHYTNDASPGGFSDSTFLAAIQDVKLNIGLEGQIPPVETYDTAPVVSRPVRDIVSHDLTNPTVSRYTAPDQQNGNTNGRELSYLRNVTPTTGDGWSIDNDKTRDYFGHPSSDVLIETAGRYGFTYTADIEFNDRTSDPANPDELEMELRIASTGGSISPSDEILGSASAFDISAVEGDVDLTFISNNTRVAYSIPDSLDNYLSRSLTALNIGNFTELGVERPNFTQYTRYRWRAWVQGQVNSAPGPMDVAFWTGANQASPNKKVRIDSILSHSNPTAGSPATFSWLAFDSENPNGLDSDQNGLIVVFNRTEGTTAALHFNVFNYLRIHYEILIDDDDNRSVTIDVPDHSFNANDRVFLRAANETSSTHSRNITVSNQKLSIWDVVDVTGRNFNASGTLSQTEMELVLGTETDTTWWGVNNVGELTAREDMRQATVKLTVPSGAGSAVYTIWREFGTFTTRERIARGTIGNNGGTIAGTTLAVVANERFIVTADRHVSATLRVDATAQTVQGISARQVRTAGLLRSGKVADTVTDSTGWQRIALDDGFTWAEDRALTIMIGVNKNTTDSVDRWTWVTFAFHTRNLQELTPIAPDRLGESLDQSMEEWLRLGETNQAGTVLIQLAPIDDGGIAMSGLSAEHPIKIFAE